MSEIAKSVIIDGVRYVPAAEITPALDDFKRALLELYWGSSYLGRTEEAAAKEVHVVITDQPEDDEPSVYEFFEELAATLAARNQGGDKP